MQSSRRLILLHVVLTTQLILVTGPIAAAEVYKWVDSKGHTHFGDKPPQATESVTRIDTSAATRTSADPNAGARRERQQKLLNALSSERKEREETHRKTRLKDARLKRDCVRTKRSLTALERTNLLYTKDNNGERLYASETQRAQLIARLKTTLRKHC